MLMLNYCIIMIFIGFLVFSSQRKHLLLTLLSLEFLVLCIYLIVSLLLKFFLFEFFFLMIFLTFSVCEGALGLSILVSLIRSHGNDFFQSFNLLC
uniref:NADH-ubiquinone oxidoreductase chain 4L n=1 Tax=Agrilinae sp. 2 ACP-2013 TaxID=1434405 RepID=A0A3G4RYQ0_9COLE|nr:NADH dehydrogenase subunit 4L [Agrilinae sp. 2 ACP-2013]